MKWTVALLLFGVALAGCTAGDDDPNPPNADPNPSETFPAPATSSTPPSTGTNTPPSTSPSNSSSSSTGPGPARFGPHGQDDSATDPDFSGLMVGGRLSGSGSLVEVEASANNFGERAYRVPDGCRTPWTESMRGPTGAVQLRQPAATCAADSWRDLAAHDSLARTFEWNGTLWDASGAFVPAPAGTYTWSIAFDAYSGPGSPPPEHGTLTLEFEVTVG